MAILKGIEVNVTVGGKKLVEYDEKFAEPDVADRPKCHHFVSKYIEAKAGAVFGISFAADAAPDPDGKFVGVSYKAYLDDNCAFSITCSKFPHSDTQAFAVQGKPGHYIKRPLTFADLDQSYVGRLNETIIASQKREVAKVGVLRVEVFRALEIKKVPAGEIIGVGEKLTSNNVPVSAKALLRKGNDMRASLGAAQKHTLTTMAHPTAQDPPGYPFLVFQFLYRSRSSLQALLIIPRTPSPEPLERRALESLTNAEALELLRQYRKREEAQKAVKKEGVNVKIENTAADMSGRVKRERPDDDELTEVSTRPVKRKFEGPPIEID